jgi:hypothetical protein
MKGCVALETVLMVHGNSGTTEAIARLLNMVTKSLVELGDGSAGPMAMNNLPASADITGSLGRTGGLGWEPFPTVVSALLPAGLQLGCSGCCLQCDDSVMEKPSPCNPTVLPNTGTHMTTFAQRLP